jgi:hypothetical protein
VVWQGRGRGRETEEAAIDHFELLAIGHFDHLAIDHLHYGPVGHFHDPSIRVHEPKELPVRQLHHQPVVPSFSVFIFCRKTLTEKFFVKVREGPLDGLS